MIHVYTGDGEGKTTTALGLAFRCAGHGERIVFLQFMKGRKNIGEYRTAKKLDNIDIKQFGRKEFMKLSSPEKEDYELAEKGLSYAKKVISNHPPFLLVLDEINLAVSIGLLEEKEVLDLLDNVPEKVHVVLTGSNAPESFIKKADLATDMKKIKHPFDKGIKNRKGIDY